MKSLNKIFIITSESYYIFFTRAANNKSLIIYLVLFAYLFNIKLYSSEITSEDFGIISLMYHRFEENKYPSTNIRINEFKNILNLSIKKISKLLIHQIFIMSLKITQIKERYYLQLMMVFYPFTTKLGQC